MLRGLSKKGQSLPVKWRVYAVLPVWITLSVLLWGWWLQAERIETAWLYVPLTLAMLYEFLFLPSVFLFFLLKAKKPKRRRAQKDLKVAVISPCVPKKESIEIIEKQLIAMKKIEYPHDSWILDEGGNKKIKALAKKHGVKYFTRKGKKQYNQELPPFAKKTKAGNVNAWLDHVKRYNYEYFVQLDIDHIPNENYLDKTLGHFRDPKVAWVQAPSLHTANADSSWTALGSVEQELVLQGPLQMGFYSFSQTPFIIGSHCTYRMSAITEIGGFQPTRAEDHLNTVVLASKGYEGVFVPEVLAEGEGPETLSVYLNQQFAWAYSMFQVLLFHSPKLLPKMTIRKILQFIFSQTWYPLWTLSYLTMFSIPMLSLLAGSDVANMEAERFAFHFLPIFAASFLIWWSARPLMLPKDTLLTWRGMILHIVRWPIVLKALVSVLFKIKKSYMITPKGRKVLEPLQIVYRPFLILGSLSAASVIAALFLYPTKELEAQYLYASLNSLLMLGCVASDMTIRYKGSTARIRGQVKKYWLKPALGIFAAFIILSTATVSASTNVVRQNNIQPQTPELNQDIEKLEAEVVRPADPFDDLVIDLKVTPNNYTGVLPAVGFYTQDHSSFTEGHYVKHVFSNWNDLRYIIAELQTAKRAGHPVLLTLEPSSGLSGKDLLEQISEGRFDSRLQELTNIFKAAEIPVYVRFAHEMDLANVYPWGAQDPDLFIQAYTHVIDTVTPDRSVNTLKPADQNVYWVWSPAGNIGSEQYYPGDNYVDVIGVTVLYDKFFYGSLKPTFREMVEVRRALLTLNKPVWIVEFGVGRSGDPTLQESLVEAGLSQYRALGFKTLIYLDVIDRNVNGPDYSLDNKQLLKKFTQ